MSLTQRIEPFACACGCRPPGPESDAPVTGTAAAAPGPPARHSRPRFFSGAGPSVSKGIPVQNIQSVKDMPVTNIQSVRAFQYKISSQ
jgi:hypothetical protein